MKLLDVIASQRAAILEIAARHSAHHVRVFGSVVRGEDDPESDVDILVDMDPDRSLLDLVALECDLAGILGRRVDVVVDGGISPYLKDRIPAEAVPL